AARGAASTIGAPGQVSGTGAGKQYRAATGQRRTGGRSEMAADAWNQHVADVARLLLEDICSDLARFLHSDGDPRRFGAVKIDSEYALDLPNAFADIRIEPADTAPYFLEVKYGYDSETIVSHMRRKYGQFKASGRGEF